jgi:thiamine biosynthesis lipoprotein
MSIVSRVRPLLGTLVEIVVDNKLPRAETEHAIAAAFAVVERVQQLMSYHDPRSELSRLNREAWLRPVRVSEETWQVLNAAQQLSAASGGLFDITVAPVLERAGFLPPHADSLPATARGCWRDIALLPDQQVRFTRRLRIDLGGIAKGYAVDQAIEALRAAGVTTGHVNAGGDLRVLGLATHTLHLRHPEQPTVLLPLQTGHAAAATSAGYFQHRPWAGRECSAIVHPGTRLLCEARRSVTVLADQCMVADALTKVVMADPERGSALLEQHRARALILEPDLCHACRVFDSAA